MRINQLNLNSRNPEYNLITFIWKTKFIRVLRKHLHNYDHHNVAQHYIWTICHVSRLYYPTVLPLLTALAWH
jgi:hypothetical protein